MFFRNEQNVEKNIFLKVKIHNLAMRNSIAKGITAVFL